MLVECFADIQVSEVHFEVLPSNDKSLEVYGLEASEPTTIPISDAHPKAANSEEAQDGSEASTQPKKSFKYKDPHP